MMNARLQFPFTPRRNSNGNILRKLGRIEIACALFAVCVALAIAAPAQDFKTLARFDYTDGAYPVNYLVQGFNGNLYGVANGGGANAGNCPNQGGIGCGAIFEITPTGQFTTIFSFCAGCNGGLFTGIFPTGGLVEGANGNLYGTTSNSGPYNEGTIFEITPNGALTTLYSFCPNTGCTDGTGPQATLLRATNGNFYGTTLGGGTNGYGTVFEITPAGKFTTLYSFCSLANCVDGKNPFTGLILGTNGNFYGTVSRGGTNGVGTVFEITPAGKLTTLYNFCSQAGCADGQIVETGLIQATDGNIYGTTGLGGNAVCGNGCGTLFQITPAGTLTTMHTFCASKSCSDGAYPSS